MHTLYYDRTLGQMDGRLTLQYVDKGNITELFKHLPVRSGQMGYINEPSQDWIRGKGGTPFGTHWLKCSPVPLQMNPKNTPFHLISSEKRSDVIHGPKAGQARSQVGLHLENEYVGSAGCCVLIKDTPTQECLAWALLKYLETLAKYEPYIRFIVL